MVLPCCTRRVPGLNLWHRLHQLCVPFEFELCPGVSFLYCPCMCRGAVSGPTGSCGTRRGRSSCGHPPPGEPLPCLLGSACSDGLACISNQVGCVTCSTHWSTLALTLPIILFSPALQLARADHARARHDQQPALLCVQQQEDPQLCAVRHAATHQQAAIHRGCQRGAAV